MLVHAEIYIPSLDIEVIVSADLWMMSRKISYYGSSMIETDSDVGPLSWDKSEFPGMDEEIAMWLDVNYEKVEKKLWEAYRNEIDALDEAYQLRNI